MADALVLAAGDHPDAIVDVATLTGSALLALGPGSLPSSGTTSG
jgi:leucyl aminopeptidase